MTRGRERVNGKYLSINKNISYSGLVQNNFLKTSFNCLKNISDFLKLQATSAKAVY